MNARFRIGNVYNFNTNENRSHVIHDGPMLYKGYDSKRKCFNFHAIAGFPQGCLLIWLDNNRLTVNSEWTKH